MRALGLVCLVTLVTACSGEMLDGSEDVQTSDAALEARPPIANLKVASFGVKPDGKPAAITAPLPDMHAKVRSGQLLVKFKSPLAPTPTMQAFRGVTERTLTDEAKRRLPSLPREGVRVSRARALHAPHRLQPNAKGSSTPTAPLGEYVLDVEGTDASLESLAKKVLAQPEVEWVEPNYIREASAVPNDTYYSYQWHLPAISAPAAWDTTKGRKHIIIAVVDTGVDYTHPDLAPNVWTNTDEVAGDGIDNDNNGFVDDVRGWDFAAGDADPMDELGHGTHVSGIAGARGNDGVGIAGVAWNARLMAVRAGDASGQFTDSSIVGAIHYAVDNGADVINMSFGGPEPSAAVLEAVRYATQRDVVVVAAAGNESGYGIPYPAAYSEVISVAALDESGAVAGYSNYGSFVDVAAPGTNILSTLTGGWGYASGTSMAAPVVSGLAALAKSAHPDFSADAIRYQILSTATDLSGPNPNRVTRLGSGKVNAQKAVAQRSAAPWVSLLESSVRDITGDGDSELEAGETAQLTAVLAGFADTTTAAVSLSSSDPWLTVPATSVNVNVPYGGTTSAVLSFGVKSGVPANRVATVTVRVQSGSLVRTFPIDVTLAPSFRNYLELPPTITSSMLNLPASKMALVFDNLNWRANGHWRVYGTIREANGAFSTPVLLSNPATDAANVAAYSDASGNVHAVYRQFDASHDNPKLYYVRYQAGSWSTPELVSAPDDSVNWYSPVAEESIVLDAAGRPHVSWYDFAPMTGQGSIRTAVRTASGWTRTTHFAAPGFAEGAQKLLTLPNGNVGFFYSLGQNGSQYLAEWNGTSWSTPRFQAEATWQSSTKLPFVFGGELRRFQVESSLDPRQWTVAGLSNEVWSPLATVGSSIGNSIFKEHVAFEMYGANQFGVLDIDGPKQRFVTTNGVAETEAPLRLHPLDYTDAPSLVSGAASQRHAFVRGYVYTQGVLLNSYTAYTTTAPIAASLKPAKPVVTDSGASTTSPITTVSWSVSGAAPAYYRLGVGTAPGRDDVARFARVEGTSATLDLGALLEPGRTYYFSVRAIGTGLYESELGVSDGLLYNPVLRCTADPWSPTVNYGDPGTLVTYGGNTYRNQWYHSGITPTPQGNGPWKLVGACSGQPALSVCDNPAWNASTIYQSGEVVNYGGYEYLNLWYAQGQVPTGQSGNAWQVIGACPTN